MKKLMPVKDYPDLARDMNTGMIVNINKDKHRQYLEVVEQIKKEKEEIESLKTDVQQIKMMLQQLLENGSNG